MEKEQDDQFEGSLKSGGMPVVRRMVLPPGGRVLMPEQEAARARMRARMQQGWPIGAGKLDRDKLHER
jgi:hypothetical protein